jgi:predicted enzyme related to lactoylglutathione lyase
MAGAVVHFEITGTDGAKLRSFYTELFDWKINADNPMGYGIVESEQTSTGQAGLPGGIAQGPEGYPGHVTVYVEVPDVEAAMAKAESLGGKRLMGPEQVMENVEIGLFHDPEGHVIGLIKAVS